MLRRFWHRTLIRDVHYTDRRNRLKLLYWLKDPWDMESEIEQSRFRWVNNLIETHLLPFQNILEVGCGEGHQSLYLLQMCKSLYGIDISTRAIRRAQRRCRVGRFAVSDPFQLRFDLPFPARFDLVVACEVLYYMKEVDACLHRLSQLGRNCLVTYHHGQAAHLDPYFDGRPSNSEIFRFGETSWTARWWRNGEPCGASRPDFRKTFQRLPLIASSDRG
jgi:SAM-dependent methyltransferase